MDDIDKESKTESPTEKRIKDSQEEGNVPVSREVPLAGSILCFAVYLSYFADENFLKISRIFQVAVESGIGQTALSNIELRDIAIRILINVAIVILPLFGLMILFGLIFSAGQTQPRFVVDRITPKYSRISPGAGWKRLNSLKNYFEFFKSLLKLALFFAIIWFQMRAITGDLTSLVRKGASSTPAAISSMIAGAVTAMTVAAVAVAALDFVWQRKNWLRDLRMTLQQVKDEVKQAEGDPIVKSRLRSLGRSRARNRMMRSVPTATLIIANPTHLAIALRYDRARDAAPVVVAMGADLIALRIREIAEQHAVPVFEQVDLARALFKVVRVDQIIPQNFYQALAVLIREIEA